MNYNKKKRILIYWPTRNFIEVIVPILPKIAENFNIFVILSDYSTPVGMIELLNSLKNSGRLMNFYITPPHSELLRNILYLKKLTPELKTKNINLFLTESEVYPNHRYIMECILPKNSISVIMWPHLAYLFMYNKSYVKQLLAGEKIPEFSSLLVSSSFFQKVQKLIKIIINKKKKLFSYYSIHLVYSFIYNNVVTYWIKKTNLLNSRVIYPFLLTGKKFRFGPFDEITQLGSGRSDAFIFFDELESIVHKKLFITPLVYAAQYTTAHNCKCKYSSEQKKSILSPLSNFIGYKKLPENVLKLYYREYQTVIQNSLASRIDLRLHPDEKGMWAYQLCDYLCEQGIDSRICRPDLPLREIVCDYLGVAGSASSSLRDCRAVCNYVFVIGFAGVSLQFQDPKFVFAQSEGIGWINEDGSYDPKIFEMKRYNPPKRKTVPEILYELSEKQSMELGDYISDS